MSRFELTGANNRRTCSPPQLVLINLLRIQDGWTDEQTTDYLDVMDTIQRELQLKMIPNESTLTKAYDRISCWMFRWLLKESSNRIDSRGKMAVDGTSFVRHWASRYYTQRPKMSLSALKVTIRADVGETLAVRDVHVTTTKKHDTQIMPKLIPRDESGSILAADKGYDQKDLRD